MYDTKKTVETSMPKKQILYGNSDSCSPEMDRPNFDIENQINNTKGLIEDIHNTFNTIYKRLEVVMAPAFVEKDNGDKCVKEEQISPLATELKSVNTSLNHLRYKMGDIVRRLQV